MKKTQVIKHYGSVREAAAALDISTQAIYAWGDIVPKQMQKIIEMATSGKLKAAKPVRAKVKP